MLMMFNFSMDSIMDNIIEASYNFDFAKLSLAHPTAIQGGAHFTKLLMNGKPLYIQTPKCTTRQGFIKTGKKIHCDLMFNNNDEEFIHWMESLETKCQDLVFHKSNDWFQNPLEQTDIEAAFNSPLKVYKSGKFYLVRTNVKINSLTGQPLIKLYNENEAPVQMEDINTETNVISILEIQGIKFTPRNFQIDIEIKQVMLLNKDIIFENCLIKKNKDVPSLVLTSAPEPMPVVNDDVMAEVHGKQDENVDIKNEGDEADETDEKDTNELTEKVQKENIEESQGPDSLETTTSEEKQEEPASINLKLEIDTTDSATSKNDNVTEDYLVDSILETMEEPSNELTEFNIDLHLDNSSNETIELKKPDRVYYEIYKNVREKAKKAKQEAMNAYLEAKNIKKTYMLENLSDSSEEDTMDDMSDVEDE